MSESSKSTLPPGVTPRNLCQPSSILEERNTLGLPLLLHAVADAANLGYNFLTVSGDEPLRYPWLAALCREAHKHGMLTSMISRSMALTAPQLEWLRFSIDLLGIEVEGRTPRQNRRGRVPRGVQTVEQRLAVVRESGIPFAIVFPLTTASLPELEWAAEFAADQGAAMLQVRPSEELTDEQMATAWMMVECLCELQRGKLVIHFDAVNRYSLPTEPGDLASWKQDLEREARYLGEIVSPLVIEIGRHGGAPARRIPAALCLRQPAQRRSGHDDRALDRDAIGRVLRGIRHGAAQGAHGRPHVRGSGSDALGGSGGREVGMSAGV